MAVLSQMNQNDRLKVLEKLYTFIVDYEAWDREVLTCKAEIDKYRREKMALKKKHKTVFLTYMWFVDTFIMASVIVAITGFFMLEEEGNGFMLYLGIFLTVLFLILLLTGYAFRVRADKKSCSDVLFSEYLAEIMIYCHSKKQEAGYEASNIINNYAVPGVLNSSRAIEHVYDTLVRYPSIQLLKAVDSFISSERNRMDRERAELLSRQLDDIKRQSEQQHMEKMKIARQIESENRSIANYLDDIRYKTGSHY